MLNSYAFHISKLNSEYRDVFNRIRDYVIANNIDDIRGEEMLSEVMDSFLASQEEGRDVNKVIGGDLQVYCKDLCSEIGIKSRIISVFELISPVFTIYAIMSLLDIYDYITVISSGNAVSFFSYRSHNSLLAYLIGGLIVIVTGIISRAVTRKLIFSDPARYKKISSAVRGVTVVAILLVFIFLFKDSTTPEGTYLWLGIASCVVFFGVRHIIYKDSIKYKKENSISIAEFTGIDSQAASDIENQEMKRFNKINNKNKLKGKSEISFDAFLDMEEKKCNSFDRKPAFFVVMAIGGTLLGLLLVFATGGFAIPADVVFFLIILLLAEGIIMYGLYKIINAGTRARLKWIEVKRSRAASEAEIIQRRNI